MQDLVKLVVTLLLRRPSHHPAAATFSAALKPLLSDGAVI
ncbi:hypothetical protein BH18ACT8_BH18ACT8_17300 [soil metagenome]